MAALHADDRPRAIRWLERAHRLVPNDPQIGLALATAWLDHDNATAAELYRGILAVHDIREAWWGLAAACSRLGRNADAAQAIELALRRFSLTNNIAALADTIAVASGAPGWCGLLGNGTVRTSAIGTVDIRLDGQPLVGMLPHDAWSSGAQIGVTKNGQHLLGSPIDIPAIARLTGWARSLPVGIEGWAWHPGDPETEPVLTIRDGAGHAVLEVRASDEARESPNHDGWSRPRAFLVPAAALATFRGPFAVVGRDGRDLPTSPSSRLADTSESVPDARQKPNRARWRSQWAKEAESVIFVTHADGGGVERRVAGAAKLCRDSGRWPIVLRPTPSAEGPDVVLVCDGTEGPLPDLAFPLPQKLPALLRLLRATRPAAIEVHHLLNHPPAIYRLIQRLGVPYDVHLHDYALVCPRISLVGAEYRYCGEPDLATCEVCIETRGRLIRETIGVAALRERSAAFLATARRVIVPSRDTGTRMRRYFPDLRTVVVPHGDDSALPATQIPSNPKSAVLVCVAGGIGLHKGYDILLGCARDAAERSLPLEFVVVGDTTDDDALHATGKVFVTGTYRPDEAINLIRRQNADLGFLPSVWPETWSLTLTELWQAGLRVIAFDMGAPAERITATGRGLLLPYGLQPPAINDALLAASRTAVHEGLRRS